jgi:hypothetical protein
MEKKVSWGGLTPITMVKYMLSFIQTANCTEFSVATDWKITEADG